MVMAKIKNLSFTNLDKIYIVLILVKAIIIFIIIIAFRSNLKKK